MPDVKVAFIDPKAALAALTPIVGVKGFDPAPKVEGLGPSGPHFDEDLDEAPVQVGAELPPILNIPTKPAAIFHYTNMLDELWPEFDDLDERTAARLLSLHEDVRDEARRVFDLQLALWELPNFKITNEDRQRYEKEFSAYLRRLNDYRAILDALAPTSTETDEVYVGLVRRRKGAGPVPDAIMHMYFAQQLGILADHADDMGEGFIGRVMTGLAAADEKYEAAKDAVEDAVDAQGEAIRDAVDGTTNSIRDGLRTTWLWIAGTVIGTIVLGGAAAAVVVAAGKDDER